MRPVVRRGDAGRSDAAAGSWRPRPAGAHRLERLGGARGDGRDRHLPRHDRHRGRRRGQARTRGRSGLVPRRRIRDMAALPRRIRRALGRRLVEVGRSPRHSAARPGLRGMVLRASGLAASLPPGRRQHPGGDLRPAASAFCRERGAASSRARHHPGLVRRRSAALSHVQDEPGGRARVVTAATNDTIIPSPSGQPSLIRAVRFGLALLSPREARQAVGLSIAIAVASALEIAAVTAVLPFVNVVIQPTAIHVSGPLAELHRRAGSPPDDQFIGLLGVVVIVLTVLAAVGSWIILRAQNRFAASCQTRLAQDLLDRCIHAPYAWFIGRNSVVLSRLVYEDVWYWSRGFVQRLMMVVNDILVVVMGVVVVLVLSRRTGLLVLTAVALLAVASVRSTGPLLA